MSTTENPLTATFNKIAPVYDLMNHLLSAGFDHYWRFQTAKFVEGNILDLCTGKGEMVSYLRKSNGISFVGIDLSREMLKRFRYTHPHGYAILADAKQLPLRGDLFKTVVCAFGIRNIKDWYTLFKDLYRVLTTNGRLVILELTLPELPIRWIYTLYLRTVLPLLGNWVARNQLAYEYLAESICYFDTRKRELLREMKNAGFKNLRIVKLTGGITTIFIGEKRKVRYGRTES